MDGPQQSFLSIVNRTECTCTCFEEGAQSAWKGLRRVHRVHWRVSGGCTEYMEGSQEGAQSASRVLRRVQRGSSGEYTGCSEGPRECSRGAQRVLKRVYRHPGTCRGLQLCPLSTKH